MFSDRLKELREEKGLTQEQLSSILKISRQQLSTYETGKFEPNFETLVNIANYFNVSLDYLLERTKEMYNLNNLSKKDKELFFEFLRLMDKLRK